MPPALHTVPPRSRGRRPQQRRLRPQLPTEPPAVVAFQQYALFTSIDPDENRQRFYRLSWQPLLWGDIALIRSWGRVGSLGQQRLEATYPDRQSAQRLAERLIRRRLQRRYELVAWC